MSSGWHLDKRVSLGHLVTTLSVAVAAMLWLSSVDKRVDLNAQEISHNSDLIERSENRQAMRFGEILDRLDRIEAHLLSRQGQ